MKHFEDDIQFSDKLIVTPGVRYESYYLIHNDREKKDGNGEGAVNNDDYTSLINERHYLRLKNYIDEAKKAYNFGNLESFLKIYCKLEIIKLLIVYIIFYSLLIFSLISFSISSGSKSILILRASKTSPDPHFEETALFPCFATLTP